MLPANEKNILFLLLCYLAVLCKDSQPCELIHNRAGEAVKMQPAGLLASNLTQFGHTSQVVITQQAKHYQLSVVEYDAATQKVIYKYKPALNYIGGDSIAFRTEDCVTMLKLYEKWIANAAGSEKHLYISNYTVYLVKPGRSKEALPILRKLAIQQPGEYEILANLAVAFERNGYPDSALKYMRQSLKINPGSHNNSEWFHLRTQDAATRQRLWSRINSARARIMELDKKKPDARKKDKVRAELVKATWQQYVQKEIQQWEKFKAHYEKDLKIIAF